ncbi:Protein O-mannosyl-transferase TMTC, DUF1736 [Popillia japonica]|uniref:dolichyl-phosphate-mannose--protein mannosyltransferase n=1 Tax=Popillia japonica TaxID=7064 RepID=A0AAW1K1R2_POPJA
MRQIATIALIGILCYCNSLFGSFVFDDAEAIVKNKDILPSTPLINVFKNDFGGTDVSLYTSHKSYRPITILSYRLNMIVSGSNLSAFQFHLMNVLLYIALSVLLYPTIRMLLMESKTCAHGSVVLFLSTLLFRTNNDSINVFKNDFWGTDVSLNTSHKSYRPITILSYRLNMIVSGSNLSAFQFHLTNVLLYIVLCILLYPTIRMLLMESKTCRSDVPFLSTLLFTVHPLHTEVVSGLVGRADLLCSILMIVSVLLYKRLIKTNSVMLFSVIYLIIFVAVLCKETAITALGLCSMYDIFYTRFRKRKFDINFVYRNVALATAGLTILYFRFWIMNFEGPTFAKIDNPAAFSDHILTRILTYNYIYFLNVLLMIWPQWLCFDWSMGCIPVINNFCDTRVVFVLVDGVYPRNQQFFFVCDANSTTNSLALSLLILPFVPASNIFFKVGFVIAERALLLPSAGYCILIVLGGKKLQKRFRVKEHIWRRCFYLTCILFAVRTIQQVCPKNAKVHYNIAKVAADNNDKQIALDEYRMAIELNPEYERAMNNLANLLREEKQFEEAEILLRRALKV